MSAEERLEFFSHHIWNIVGHRLGPTSEAGLKWHIEKLGAIINDLGFIHFL